MNQNSQNLIFYSAQTAYNNLGDLMINKILLTYLRKYGKLLVDSREVPDDYLKNLGIEPDEKISQFTLKPNYLMILLRIKSLFHQPNNQKIYQVFTPGHRYAKPSFFQSLPLLKFILINSILRIFGIRLCQFGISIGPFSKPLMIHEVWKSKLMYFYSVRDNISKEYAHKIGVKNVYLFPDLAWLMEVDSQKYLHKDGQESDYIIFSYRSSTHAFAPSENYQKQLFNVLDKIVEIARLQWSKKLVISYQVDQDYQFCKTIAQRYQTSIDVTFIEQILDESSMYDLYSNAYMVFSNRLHVLLFSLSCGSLPVGVIDKVNHDKITGIFNDAGLEELLIDIGKDTVEDQQILAFSKDINLWKQKIADVRRKQQDLAKQYFTEIFS
ncbi:polysaccharide pyruvyl transferase family protein [Gloeothece verrucosa]|uniref:Polysaccharide pyruvyl transferase domain-containing protein n=1 Tax=Gloeothece verrucosa (strain PCC 7822) TaxID=497965 RepID=E0U6K9_GLOV7|nr:polysaccharide pyruvyl transferase family protein [Gloeothece verrucosa]ADN14768.1 conserved hypothetical protein [Gloeothece verrucosa PCC 7822]